VKNGLQAANERFFAFPENKLIYKFQTYFGLIIFYAKKILSRGKAIFQRFRLSNDQRLVVPVGYYLVAHRGSAERAGIIVFLAVG
jgi:hypothetical protein